MPRPFGVDLGEFLKRSRDCSEINNDEKALWIQSGLAISPLMGTCLQYSLDFCLAWALIGEWTSRVLFPVPAGQWPRHGHAGALLQEYQSRTPRIVAWARAAFEQGALPSLLLLPGIAPVFSLPGDRMFQAVEVVPGLQRPAIMHAYGGAKVGMEKALASIAREGWLPMAAAMLGTVDKPPMWACLGLRPVVGTTIDLKVRPAPISEREKLLLLSCWRQWHPAWEQIQDSALSDWLTGVDVEKGPDGSDSPTFLKQHSEIMQAVGLYQEAKLSPLEDLFELDRSLGERLGQLALRSITHEYPESALLTIYSLSATGNLTPRFPLDQWIQAVQWHGASRILAVVNTLEEWEEALKLLAPLERIVVEAKSPQDYVVWTSAQSDSPTAMEGFLPLTLVVRPERDIQPHLPATLHVETTGLGGRDLNYPTPWDISIRSDKEGQSVYGPSLSPLEESVSISNSYGNIETCPGLCFG